MQVRVLARSDVEAGGAEGVDAVISIRASVESPGEDLDLAIRQATLGDLEACLRLHFDDIAVPEYGPYRGPTMEDVSAVLDFARAVRERTPDGVLVVHCLHGRSRSSAMALAVLADELGPGRESDAVAALLRQDVVLRMHPNPLIVSLADAALFRYGRIEAALMESCPRYTKWRTWWRSAAVDPKAHWAQARKARFRRRAERD